MRETREGGCHCGRVRFRAEVDLDHMSNCSCSVCTKKGMLHLSMELADFKLLQRVPYHGERAERRAFSVSRVL